MECYGFSKSALLRIQNYLTNRKQVKTSFFFNGSYSECKTVKCGVPQGSCLGPLLYSIFTNDLPLVLNKANICMYADDSTIYTSALSANDLNTALKELQSVVECKEK